MGCHICDKKNDINIEQINDNRFNNENENLNNSFFSINEPNNLNVNMNENKAFKISLNNNKINKNNNFDKTNSFNSTNHTISNPQKVSLESLRMLMLNEINLSREFPNKIPEKIEKYINNIGKNSKNEFYIKVDNYNKIKLFKGIESIKECKNYLQKLTKFPPLELKYELTFPFPGNKDYTNNLNNINLEDSINENYLTQTLQNLTNELKLKNIEIVNFHYDIMNYNIELSVLLQILDDTNSQFQRRKNIFIKDAKYIGINVGRINESLFCYYLSFGKDA